MAGSERTRAQHVLRPDELLEVARATAPAGGKGKLDEVTAAQVNAHFREGHQDRLGVAERTVLQHHRGTARGRRASGTATRGARGRATAAGRQGGRGENTPEKMPSPPTHDPLLHP